MNKKQIANVEMKAQTLAMRSWQIVIFDSASPPPHPNLCGSSEMTWG